MEWLFLAAIFNGAFLALAIPFIQTRNKLGKYFLSGIFVVLCFVLLDSYLAIFKGRSFFGIGLLGEFFLAPLIYLFVLSLITERLAWRSGFLIWFIPALVASVMLALINVGAGGLALSDFTDQRFWGTAVWVGIKFICIFAFIIPAYLLLSRHLGQIPSKARKFARPVRVIFLVTGLLLFGVYVNYYLYYFNLPGIPDSDNYSLLLLSFMLFMLGLLVIVRRSTLDGFGAAMPITDALAAGRLKALIEKEKIYLDPDVTLKGLSEKTRITEKELSQACYQVFSKSFLDLMNEKRVGEFKRLTKTNKGNLNILELAFEAGFNSKATFYRAFRKLEGMNPADYLKKYNSLKK